MTLKAEVDKRCDVPVLLITWRRPETTRQVINALRHVSPKLVFVASDGPRNVEEASKVQQTRNLINTEINWDCQIHRRFSSDNQGCRVGVSSAISWFFTHVEQGIILEDDCVPHPFFFEFCSKMLDRYRDDSRIWTIGGSNYQDGNTRGYGAPYYFSRYMLCWGWATWRQRWTSYANNEQMWNEISISDTSQRAMFSDPIERSYWLKIWSKLYTENVPDSWAYRWQLVCMANRGLSVTPNFNLIHNVGIGDDSTHTQSGKVPLINYNGSADLQLIPNCILHDAFADRYAFDYYMDGIEARKSAKLHIQLTRSAKNLLLMPLRLLLRIIRKSLNR